MIKLNEYHIHVVNVPHGRPCTSSSPQEETDCRRVLQHYNAQLLSDVASIGHVSYS